MGASTSKEEFGAAMLERIVDKSAYECLAKDYDYENLAFEGGGAKGIAYAGAVKAMEDLGILKKVKRISGTSIGSLTALLLAIGANAVDVTAESLENLDTLTGDSCKIAFLTNMFSKFGWYPGNRLLAHLRQRVERFTGNPDLTFKQLYELRGVELCVIVTNVSTCNIEYCHVKTTPDLPVVLAVKMSMSLPVLFQPMIITDPIYKHQHIFIDGGLMLNYPLNVFDGWFLSMKPEDSFFHRIGSHDQPFQPENKKTLGVKVFDVFENESDELTYLKRYDDNKPKRPNSDLSVEKSRLVDAYLLKKKQKLRMREAASKFLKFLSTCDTDGNGTISLEEFKKGLQKISLDTTADEEFNRFDWALLFDHGPSYGKTINEIFNMIDKNQDKQIEFPELLSFMSEQGIPLREIMMRGCTRSEVRGFGGFIGNVMETFSVRIRTLSSTGTEPQRSMGLFTDYVGTTDLMMAIKDKEYIIKLGWLGAIGFFKYLNRKAGNGDESAE